MVSASSLLSALPLCCALLAGCVDLAAVQAEAERGVYQRRSPGTVALVPWMQIAGANAVQRVDPTGVPVPGAGMGAPVRLVRPGAVALGAGELTIVDSGLGTVFRLVIGSSTMNALSGAPAQPGVRVQAAGDRSVYLLDPASRRVLRLSPSGQLLQTLNIPPAVVGLPVDLAVDERRGLIVLADATFNQLALMPLLGGSAYALIPRGAAVRLTSLVGVASGADGFFATDVLCRCVTLFAPNGTVIASFGRDTLVSPGALAVDREERVYVADRADQSLKVYAGGRQIAVFTAKQLDVTEIADLALDDGTLAVADGVGARVALLRVLAADPPAEGDK